MKIFGLNISLATKSLGSLASGFARGDDLAPAAGSLALPYAQSAWIQAAVKHISGEISGRPLKFYRADQEYADQRFAEFWKRPALGPATRGSMQPRMPLADVLRDLSAWASLEGENFIILDDSWLLATARTAALAPFMIGNPTRMRFIIAGGELQGYSYSLPGGRQLSLVPEQVVHWKAFNPYDDWRGAGALLAASVAAEGAFSTGVYIRDLMRNNGDQGFIVVGKNGVVDDNQRQAIVADLRAKRRALQRGVAKDLFLTGDITVERPPERAASTDLNVGKGMSHQEIFVAFGVPPSMAEVKASYSIGKDSDYYQLISRTCIPQGVSIAGSLAMVGSRLAGMELEAELDWDDHPVMIEVRNGRIDIGMKLWGAGMPMEAVNGYLGLGMKAYPGWEVGYLSYSVAPVQGGAGADAGAKPIQDPTQDPAMAESEPASEDSTVSQMRMLLGLRRRQRQVPVAKKVELEPEYRVFACCCHGDAGAIMKDRSEAELRLWKSHMSQRMETLRGFESGIRRVLMDARAETLGNIETAMGKAKAVIKTAAADIIFDQEKFRSGLLVMMRKRETVALDKAGDQLFQELGRDDAFKYPPAKAVEFLRGRENRLSGASDAIFDQVMSSIEEGLQGGETMDALASRVRDTFNGITDGRARTIASTELAACYGTAREEAMQEAGVPFKSWLTSGNANVRAAHAAANNQTVPVDEAFVVGGEQLQFPGDPSGSPENVVSCHCVSIAKASKQ